MLLTHIPKFELFTNFNLIFNGRAISFLSEVRDTNQMIF